MRLLSLIYLSLLKQGYKESPEFFWKMYSDAKGKGLKRKIACSVLHKMYVDKGANIATEASIADKPTFPHGIYGIFVSRGAKIGKNCVIFHQVTIGSNTIEGSKGFGAPVIGDNVYIGVGAKIIGGITIGNNCRIGAGCVVTEDVPDNSTVVMQKPRIIMRDNNMTTGFSEYKA